MQWGWSLSFAQWKEGALGRDGGGGCTTGPRTAHLEEDNFGVAYFTRIHKMGGNAQAEEWLKIPQPSGAVETLFNCYINKVDLTGLRSLRHIKCLNVWSARQCTQQDPTYPFKNTP